MAEILGSYFAPSGAYDIGTPVNRFGNLLGTAGAVTQATGLTTGVTLNATSGVITCFAATLVALTTATFTVTNSLVTANSSVVANVCGFAGVDNTNGVPLAKVGAVAAGSFTIILYNVHATQATGANSIKVAFQVLG